MKVIYTFTLYGDLTLSDKVHNDLRLIAHILYDIIYNYDGESTTPLDINDNIEYNDLSYHSVLNEYNLNSDLYDDGYIDYEPFIVGERTFALTIYDENFNINILKNLVNETLNLLKLNYRIKISSFSYVAKDIDDEKNRDKTIRHIFNKFGYKCNRKNKLFQMITHSSSKRRSRNKCREKFSGKSL